ncbi:S-layer family protein [Paenibacillus cellulosilyticus]|uniref:S-layer family protein n=1 Tax=Paenibacillus cellulosilyticus TaxID=375489 RepID=A0A2V2YXX7_9BACL|nr:S-layer homology domain-containing protein [Paenibacillus cellulosilyticus]PWW06111.1 S-layer family protein [Paenibacillus cellulosilyticus]QKS43114.1 S-layer homology domain-containing protein [Paenibacillus cellulosilyticus]
MKKTLKFPLLIALMTSLLLLIGQSVFAFSDTQSDVNADKIASLQKQGILSGGGGKFRPNDKITYAEGISMLVKGFELKDTNVYIKKPEASDYYTHVKNDAWYAPAFIIAHAAGLEVPRDVNPAAAMTREQFAHHLFKSIIRDRDIAFIELFVQINDGDDINPTYMDSVQKLIISQVVKLDDKQSFHPTNKLTRSEAASWLYDGLAFAKAHDADNTGSTEPTDAYNLQLSVNPVNKSVNEVTVTATVPHPGYGIRIASIQFEGSKARINVEIVQPDPDRMYAQVITELKAVTYVDASYEPQIVLTSDSSTSSSGGGTTGSTGFPNTAVSSEPNTDSSVSSSEAPAVPIGA